MITELLSSILDKIRTENLLNGLSKQELIESVNLSSEIVDEVSKILDDSDYKRVGKIGFIIHEKKQNGKK